jgi:hyperosmotically inducible protein
MDDDCRMNAKSLLWMRPVAAMVLVVIMSACAAARSSAPRTTAAAAPDDVTLQTRVQTSLMNATGVHPKEVTIVVSQGVATLSGTVHSQAEADAAIAAARKVEGLKDVRSDLKVQ